MEFIDAFCEYLSEIQKYCEAREVPFIYCINPSKTYIYSNYLPEGYNYKNSFLEMLYVKLEEYDINYISNVELLAEKAKTEQVFNVKYDAGHWNDLGAFYGTNNLLKKVSEYFPSVKEHKLDDFNISTRIEESLPVSKFIINEEVPQFSCNHHDGLEDLSDLYTGMNISYRHSFFRCYRNTGDDADNSLPRVMFFHGSYYIRNNQFYDCTFKETYAIHNYQNILDFDYYFNIFQPELVILETAEYATTRGYFDFTKMTNKELNPAFQSVIDIEHEQMLLSEVSYSEKDINGLYYVNFNMDTNYSYGYIETEKSVYDLIIAGGSLSCVVSQDAKEQIQNGKIHLFR